MSSRPDYVSVIGLFLSLGGGLGLLSFLLLLGISDQPSYLPKSSNPLGLASYGLSSVVSLVCGINILSGANWARWLYTGTCVFLFVFDLLFYTDKLYAFVPSAVFRCLAIALLFLPRANRYFREHSHW